MKEERGGIAAVRRGEAKSDRLGQAQVGNLRVQPRTNRLFGTTGFWVTMDSI